MSEFFARDSKENLHYAETIKVISSLSRLFSENSTPFLHYRVMENLFCDCFKAQNLSRSDTAYDAKIGTLGIGLKTFNCKGNSSIEKVAEFNKDSAILKSIENSRDLAEKLANLRNERIRLANDLYGIKNALYHIIARSENKLIFFETDYDKIDLSGLRNIKNSSSSLSFFDGRNEYIFSHSKSVLQRKFCIPSAISSVDVRILENPFEFILSLKDKILRSQPTANNAKFPQILAQNDILSKSEQKNFVILPLFSTRNGKNVPQKSGLNQWNASGRARDLDEIYIPVPREIHDKFPNFFPPRDISFTLKTPLNEALSARICQDNSKALMSNPNSVLGKWLLRKILKLKKGELATLEMLENLGFDSVIISKENELNFSIDIMPLNSYEKFISDELGEIW